MTPSLVLIVALQNGWAASVAKPVRVPASGGALGRAGVGAVRRTAPLSPRSGLPRALPAPAPFRGAAPQETPRAVPARWVALGPKEAGAALREAEDNGFAVSYMPARLAPFAVSAKAFAELAARGAVRVFKDPQGEPQQSEDDSGASPGWNPAYFLLADAEIDAQVSALAVESRRTSARIERALDRFQKEVHAANIHELKSRAQLEALKKRVRELTPWTAASIRSFESDLGAWSKAAEERARLFSGERREVFSRASRALTPKARRSAYSIDDARRVIEAHERIYHYPEILSVDFADQGLRVWADRAGASVEVPEARYRELLIRRLRHWGVQGRITVTFLDLPFQ
jgi:hypothetical protein